MNLVRGVDFPISHRLPVAKSPISLGAKAGKASIPTSKVI